MIYHGFRLGRVNDSSIAWWLIRDAIAQRYSVLPHHVDEMPEEDLVFAIASIRAEGKYRKFKEQEMKLRGK